MSTERTTLEMIAPSVEEAIEKGLNDLGVTEDAVEVEVLDAGTRGFLGLGTRQARVRLTLKGITKISEEPQKFQKTVSQEDDNPAAEQPEDAEEMAELAEESVSPDKEEVQPSDEDETLRVARETVKELLEKMAVPARVTSRYGETLDADGERDDSS